MTDHLLRERNNQGLKTTQIKEKTLSSRHALVQDNDEEKESTALKSLHERNGFDGRAHNSTLLTNGDPRKVVLARCPDFS
jgi:hypothetical protein